MTSGLRNALFVLLLAVCLAGRASAKDLFPGAEWHRIPAQEAGFSAATLERARELAARTNSTALMVVRNGAVMVEWGDTAKPTELASVRKSLLSALIGIAVADKKIDLDATLARLGIDDNPPSLSEVEKQATVRMLLRARSGVYHPALYETAEMASRRPPRGSHAPGTFWYYNNWDFNALGTIYERATGTGIFEAFDRLIAKPIGMRDYRPADGRYVTGEASVHRAYPIHMSARDLARFALLYARGGNWNGSQIVPAAWVRESTRPYSTTESGRGYGYMWWTGAGAEPTPSANAAPLPEGTFFALGNGGQTAFVFPRWDLVIVNRVDKDARVPGPTTRQSIDIARLILKAGGYAPWDP